ncbi:MAG: BON domain-containing protein [Chloroflexota bacterium]|nr:BON domain-containing protein [Chloroflexota bacterium]
MADEQDLETQVRTAQAYQRIATDIHHAIERKHITIYDLSVTFSQGFTVLSGAATYQADSDQAAQVAAQHEAVHQVHNAIIVGTRRLSWWRRLLKR